ncbi:MAG: hypothetical protein ACLP8S_20120 [Solirubrobacteraceae bacterium]
MFGDGSPNGFSDFTLNMPAPAAAPVLDSTGDYQDTIEVTGEQLAALPDPDAPGQYIVVTVGAGSGSGCPAGSDATGYGFAVGTPTALEA